MKATDSLPTQYAVKCNSRKENNEVMSLVYDKKDYTLSSYKFIRIRNVFDGSHLYNNSDSNYPEFTFAEWKQLFLGSKEKKIIGYKLKQNLWVSEEHKQFFLKGVANMGLMHTEMSYPNEDNINKSIKNPDVKRHFEAAGVFNLWFEPVYELPKPKLPTIGNYDGMYDRERGIIKYGCVECSKETIYKLNDVLKELNGCYIEHKQTHITKENVEQIIKFIKNK